VALEPALVAWEQVRGRRGSWMGLLGWGGLGRSMVVLVPS